MGFVEPFARLQNAIDRSRNFKRPFGLQNLRKIKTFEALHDHVRNAVGHLAYVQHPTDVLGTDANAGTCFAREAGSCRVVADEFLLEKLNGDRLIEGHMGCRSDESHPAAPQNAVDSVLSVDDVANAVRYACRQEGSNRCHRWAG